MNQFLSLFSLDFKAAKSWYSQQTLSKSLVLFGFIAIFASLFAGLFFLSLGFFYSLSAYEEFGLLTADYIFNASLVVLFWLGLGSALMSSLSWLLNHNPEMETLVTWPISARTLLWRFQLRGLAGTIFLLWLFLSPIHLAYHHIFTQQWLPVTQATLLLILVIIALFTHALAAIVSTVSARLLKDQGRVFVLSASFIAICLVAVGLVNALFPKTLRTLYASEPQDFTNIFYQLPLNSPFSPSRWLADSLTHHINIITLTYLLIAVLVFNQVFTWLETRLLHIYQILQVHHSRKLPVIFHTQPIRYQSPLISNFWLSFVRNAKELGYATFLILLATFFFVLLSQTQIIRQFESRWNTQLFIFVLSWIVFFSLAYALRIIFPIPTKLKYEAWLIFTSPRKRTEYLGSYLLTSFGLIMPLVIIFSLTWSILPFDSPLKWFGVSLSLWLLLVITLLNIFLGTIQPDFDHVDDPDKVSTSTSGLLSVCLTALIGGTTIIATYLFLTGVFSLATVLLITSFFSLVPLLILSIASRFNLDHYQF